LFLNRLLRSFTPSRIASPLTRVARKYSARPKDNYDFFLIESIAGYNNRNCF
jgi:hypothetical protein